MGKLQEIINGIIAAGHFERVRAVVQDVSEQWRSIDWDYYLLEEEIETGAVDRSMYKRMWINSRVTEDEGEYWEVPWDHHVEVFQWFEEYLVLE
jgi:hypothetical protein